MNVTMSITVKKVGNLSVKVVTDGGSLVKGKIISDKDVEMDNRATEAVRSALHKAKVCKKPVAKYDPISKKAYVEYADGVKKYVN